MNNPKLFQSTDKMLNNYLLYFPLGVKEGKIVYEISEKTDIKEANLHKFFFVKKISRKGVFLGIHFFLKKAQIFVPYSELEEINI